MHGPKTILTLTRYTDTADGRGTNTRVWSDIRPITGVFWTLSGNERIAYSKITEDISHKFAFENLIGETVTTRDEFRLGTRLFKIKFIDQNSDRGNWTIILLREYVT